MYSTVGRKSLPRFRKSQIVSRRAWGSRPTNPSHLFIVQALGIFSSQNRKRRREAKFAFRTSRRWSWRRSSRVRSTCRRRNENSCPKSSGWPSARLRRGSKTAGQSGGDSNRNRKARNRKGWRAKRWKQRKSPRRPCDAHDSKRKSAHRLIWGLSQNASTRRTRTTPVLVVYFIFKW